MRRDLKALADSGRLVRTHGGAEAPGPPNRLIGTPFSRNINLNVKAKRAIGKKAAEYCEQDDAVIIDAGSTTFYMCQYLAGRTLQVLTNSMPIVEELLSDTSVRLHIPGGEIFREQDIVLSPFENDGVNQYAASKMFMGAGALNARGLLQRDTILIQAEQRLMARADELIVLADSSKFEADASLILCSWDRISRVITDSGIKKEHKKMIRDHKVALDVVDVE